MAQGRIPLSALKLLGSVAFTSTPFSRYGAGMNVTSGRFFCMEAWSCRRTACFPKISRETKTKKPPTTAEREPAIKTTTKLPVSEKRKQKQTKQKASVSSVETTTFIFPLQLCTIRLYTSKAVMLSSQHTLFLCVCVCTRVCSCVLGGAALGEVGVEDGCRHGDHHCDDRHPGAPAALSEKQHTHEKAETKKTKSVWLLSPNLFT